jgi:hypothetical protein
MPTKKSKDPRTPKVNLIPGLTVPLQKKENEININLIHSQREINILINMYRFSKLIKGT